MVNAGLIYASRVFPANRVTVVNETYFDHGKELILAEIIDELNNTLVLTKI